MLNILQAVLIPQKTWDGIQLIVYIIKEKNTKTTQLNIVGKTFDDDKEVATTFNDFFVNVMVN